MTGGVELDQWGGSGGRTSASLLWRDPSGVLRAFPRIEDNWAQFTPPPKSNIVAASAISIVICVDPQFDGRPNATRHQLVPAEPVLLPVYLAFFLHYLAGWQPFGACRGCLPLCRSQLVPRSAPPEAAAGLFNLGMLAVSMRMRMYPRRVWRRPPQGLFLIYKFFVSLFVFEIAHSCIFMAVERTFYEAVPALCDAALSASAVPEMQWMLEATCGLLDTDWLLWLIMNSLGGAFLWCALSAARFLTWTQLQANFLLALSATAAVLYRVRTGPHCSQHFWG